jgi:ABC-type lipoprotein release transport system permease subunit
MPRSHAHDAKTAASHPVPALVPVLVVVFVATVAVVAIVTGLVVDSGFWRKLLEKLLQ